MNIVLVPALKIHPRTVLASYERTYYRHLPTFKREEWLRSRIALKLAYCRQTKKKLALSTLSVKKNPRGIPYISGSNLFCSISHSGGLGAAVVAPFPVGIDIERVRARSPRLLSYISAPAEQRLLPSSASRRLTTMWAVKEAVLKAMGTGLQVPMKELYVKKRIKNSYEILTKRGKQWVVNVKYRGPFCIALATPNHERTILYWAKSSDLQTAASV